MNLQDPKFLDWEESLTDDNKKNIEIVYKEWMIDLGYNPHLIDEISD